jgi:hypothetical protein
MIGVIVTDPQPPERRPADPLVGELTGASRALVRIGTAGDAGEPA